MGSIPLVALGVQPQPSVLDQYSKIMGIRQLQNQQSMFPGQQQLQQAAITGAQQQNQAGAIDIQQKQLALQNNQIKQSVLSDPKFQEDFATWQKSKSAANGTESTPSANSSIPLHPLAQYLAEKKGLPLFGPNGAMETSEALTANTQKIADLMKTQGEAGNAALTAHSKQLDNFDDLVEPILSEKDPATQAQGVTALQSEIQAHPELYPIEATQHLAALNSVPALQKAANTSKLQQMLIENATKQADMTAAQMKVAPPAPQQKADAVKTVQSYPLIPAPMRAGLSAEIQNAPTVDALQKVQARADSANESFQRSADARNQAAAMKDVAIGQQVGTMLVKQDATLQSALSNTSGIRGLLDMSKGGNQSASAAATIRFAEHEVKEGGINRFNETELNGMGTANASLLRKVQTWGSNNFTGTMPTIRASEMSAILDAEDKIATQQHTQSVDDINSRMLGHNQGAAPQGGGQNPQSKAGAATDPFAQFGGKSR